MIVQGNKEAAVRQVTTTTPHGQTLSTMLYWALSNVPPCDCHLLHLDLECCGSDKGFSLLVKSNIGDTRLTSCVPGIEMQLTQANDLVLEVVTSNTGTVCASDASHSLCQMLFAAQQDQANYLLGNFVVKNIHRPQPCAPAHCGSITLHDMIHKKGVTTYDRMIWATKLSNAALSFYSSPWIKGWTTRTIKFFAEYEQSPEPASWKPHISTTSGSSAPYFPDNIEVYSLGVMLLEIGGFDIEEFKKKPQPEVLQEAFGAIMRQMGRQYKQVAQRCFMAYQQSQVQGESPEDCVAVLSQEVTKLQKEIDACFSF
ncbi:hypothetical protein FN846DRAFT_71663 [Sphaerosporella brunnea]|uniref:DUF7580 domain-containing protein n=1 Tax=Sphaerosporella brunnea TaxID=1250544 RepID=A0A5J5ET76_9PEZI|nr:hypothetical protein FN846DRAFT_71663 [Sphaerosporella brunnea]